MRRALQDPRTQRGIVRALGAVVWCLAVIVPSLAAAEAPVSASSEAKAALQRATDAANRARWSDVRAFAHSTKDPLAKSLTTWLYLTGDGTEPEFGEATAFLARHPDWPGRNDILRKAENALPRHMSPDEVLAFFGSRAPLTGEGHVRLGEALIARGERTQGEALIKKGWIEGDFKPDREQAIRAKHAGLLRGAPSAARAERLLWARRLSEAQRLLGDLDGDAATLAQARITLMTSPSRAESVLATLPSSLRTDSGLLFEHLRAVKNAGDIRRALPIALKADPSPAPGTWWREREALVRDALVMGLYGEAYELAKTHGLSSGSDFADAEWLAGFIALRFLKKPEAALTHFRTLERGVSFPVSKARAAYWSGRAAEAAGRLAEAALMYEAASAYATTFYGQLAAVRLAERNALIELPATPAPESALHSAFLKDDVVRATALAAASGYDPMLRRFFLYLAERAQSPEQYALAGELARNLGYPQYAVRIAKRAMQQNIVLTSLAYPVVSVPESLPRGRAPEPALVLGITRQESEFDPKAVSRAGARGIMQLLPSTARLVARQQNIGYDPNRLSDPAYNTKLGAAYLGDLIDNFGGSYSLAVAAYNAGPGRVRQWVSLNGDPRDTKVDIIDWVELIPFAETRNYVQRVLENTQVYRQRLAGAPVLIRIAEDLSRPALPATEADLSRYRGVALASADGAKPKSKAEKKASRAEAKLAASKQAPPARAEPAPSAPAASPTAVAALAPEPPQPEAAKPAAESGATGETPLPTAKPKASKSTKAERVASAEPKPAPKPETRAAAATAPTVAPKADALAEAPPAAAPEPASDGPTMLAAAEMPAQNGIPDVNPFSAGQPETMASEASCMRLAIGRDGKLHCVE